MMKYMFMDGPFRGMVIKTQATKAELNSKPDIEIEFITGPLFGLVTRSLICYDREMVRAIETSADAKLARTFTYTEKTNYYGSSYY